jgi:hypothetical protein
VENSVQFCCNQTKKDELYFQFDFNQWMIFFHHQKTSKSYWIIPEKYSSIHEERWKVIALEKESTILRRIYYSIWGIWIPWPGTLIKRSPKRCLFNIFFQPKDHQSLKECSSWGLHVASIYNIGFEWCLAKKMPVLIVCLEYTIVSDAKKYKL